MKYLIIFSKTKVGDEERSLWSEEPLGFIDLDLRGASEYMCVIVD